DPEETGRGDAHDRERHVIERQRAMNDVWGGAETPLPETMGDDRDGSIRSSATRIISIAERPAEPCRNTQGLEEGAVRPHAFDELRFSTRGEIESRWRPRDGAVEQLRPLHNLPPGWIVPIGTRVRAIGQQHEPI